ncbi:alpha/beta hydrolase family esterase [Corynebacterium aquatimens]|uniref:Polyhydroxybutyrate depolymerase n=1 Tax=Corynebacterium aquatimens TaxID=1190508 RepID=A0A931DYN5_9CORY|nr:PHB depolymerase family esterase [Corynebacterium aquatimens]MBG6121444.1 polyhydroxybutyrate depolymerase [Corynebacterium aquatimens]WJY66012.1 Esterase PHB depolymerase [Corynebacterium aquatimens]
MNFKTFVRRAAIGLSTAAVALGVATAPADAQQLPPLPPQVVDAAHAFNSGWNDMARQVNGALPQGSSVPVNPIPVPPRHVPAPPTGWRAQAPQPVGNGRNGEIRAAGRSYLIWVPPGYNPSRSWPVMVGYSAFEDTTENFRNYSRLRESNVGRDAIIVYPRNIGRSWEGSPTASSRPGQDIAYVRAMINDLQRYYNIDRGRIYATGLSTGGGMAAVTGCHMADLFAGVAPVSGAFYAPTNANCQNIPIAMVIMHGTHDTLTPYHGGNRRGTRLIGVPELFGSYERRNRCQVGRLQHSPVPPNATRVSSTGCVKPTQIIKINGGSHTWWHSPNSANEMWAVLSHVRK